MSSCVAGAIIQYSGYETAFYAMGGAFGLTFILMLFWMPETAFVRTGAVNLDTSSNNVSQPQNFQSMVSNPALQIETEVNAAHKVAIGHVEVGEKGAVEPSSTVDTTEISSASQDQPLSWATQMLPYSGYINHISFFNTLVRPFAMLGSPAVLYSTLLFTTCISWLVGISITLSQIFSAPPYNFSVTAVGLTNLSAFVASLLGTIVAGPLIDGVVRRMSKRNGGTFGKPTNSPLLRTVLSAQVFTQFLTTARSIQNPNSASPS